MLVVQLQAGPISDDIIRDTVGTDRIHTVGSKVLTWVLPLFLGNLEI